MDKICARRAIFCGTKVDSGILVVCILSISFFLKTFTNVIFLVKEVKLIKLKQVLSFSYSKLFSKKLQLFVFSKGKPYKISLQVADQKKEKPITIYHSPELVGSESVMVPATLGSDNLSIDDLLTQIINVR